MTIEDCLLWSVLILMFGAIVIGIIFAMMQYFTGLVVRRESIGSLRTRTSLLDIV